MMMMEDGDAQIVDGSFSAHEKIRAYFFSATLRKDAAKP